MAEVTVTTTNIEDLINGENPVLLDFWASWCVPCKMQAPIFADAAEKLSEKAVFGKVNVDEQMSLAQKYRVVSIPTLVLIKNGEVIKKEVGLHTLEEITDMLS